MSFTGLLAASSLSSMNAKSVQAHLFRSRHADMFRQRSVIEFLVKEGNSAAVIYERLRGVYGDACMGTSSVRRWLKHFKDGRKHGHRRSAAL
jgi:hypothetical protein